MSARLYVKVDLKLIACDTGKVYHDTFYAEFFEFQDFNPAGVPAQHFGCFNLSNAKGVPAVACLSLVTTHLEAAVVVLLLRYPHTLILRALPGRIQMCLSAPYVRFVLKIDYHG